MDSDRIESLERRVARLENPLSASGTSEIPRRYSVKMRHGEVLRVNHAESVADTIDEPTSPVSSALPPWPNHADIVSGASVKGINDHDYDIEARVKRLKALFEPFRDAALTLLAAKDVEIARLNQMLSVTLDPLDEIAHILLPDEAGPVSDVVEKARALEADVARLTRERDGSTNDEREHGLCALRSGKSELVLMRHVCGSWAYNQAEIGDFNAPLEPCRPTAPAGSEQTGESQ